jgi:hypothetical protein
MTTFPRLPALVALMMHSLTMVPALAQTDPQLEESRRIAASYQDQLRGQLMGALKSGGPLLALDICKGAAPAIAQEIGKQTGATVWRISLKTRNQVGTPDAWERANLEQFNQRRAAGEDSTSMEASARTEAGFRYMKAIPTSEPCMQCHGTAIASEVAEKVVALYPQDHAIGFKPGDLRGAVSVTLPAKR